MSALEGRHIVTVTDCRAKTRKDGTPIEGVSQFGKPWKLHSVMATDETGLPIQDDLVSFDPLPLGEPIELDFTYKPPPVGHPEWNGSYTVSFPKGARRPPVQYQDDAIEMVRESVRLLADRVAALETAVKRLGGFGDLPAVPTPAVGAASMPTSDDDIPF